MDCIKTMRIVIDEWGDIKLLTQMEKKAVADSRLALFNALKAIGRDAAFADATKEQMDSVIEAIWNGLRASMHQQSVTGDIPF